MPWEAPLEQAHIPLAHGHTKQPITPATVLVVIGHIHSLIHVQLSVVQRLVQDPLDTTPRVHPSPLDWEEHERVRETSGAQVQLACAGGQPPIIRRQPWQLVLTRLRMKEEPCVNHRESISVHSSRVISSTHLD